MNSIKKQIKFHKKSNSHINLSPWIEQLSSDSTPFPLDKDTESDVVIIGAGIAGIATAFFTLRATSKHVILIERDKVGRGATGHNAGQLASYFERSLCDIADQFGLDLALSAQRSIDEAHDLLDLMVSELGTSLRIERFMGNMGMLTANNVDVHLRNQQLRQKGRLRAEPIFVSEDAEFLDKISSEFSNLYSVVSQAKINEMLGTKGERYRAVLSNLKGCLNSALLVQEVLKYLIDRYATRFRYFDNTHINRIVLGKKSAQLYANNHQVVGSKVVLCTNGFKDFVIESVTGEPINSNAYLKIKGTVGYMVAFVEEKQRPPDALSFIRNEIIGGNIPYVYLTRRTHERSANDIVTLTCIGGPERPIGTEERYDPADLFPQERITEIDDAILPLTDLYWTKGLPYNYNWHGLMAYTPDGIRVIGADPSNPLLIYNRGCNGVGLLPSIFGGDRVARIFSGEILAPSIFDPR